MMARRRRPPSVRGVTVEGYKEQVADVTWLKQRRVYDTEAQRVPRRVDALR